MEEFISLKKYGLSLQDMYINVPSNVLTTTMATMVGEPRDGRWVPQDGEDDGRYS
jgi:hypothetical protein